MAIVKQENVIQAVKNYIATLAIGIAVGAYFGYSYATSKKSTPEVQVQRGNLDDRINNQLLNIEQLQKKRNIEQYITGN